MISLFNSSPSQSSRKNKNKDEKATVNAIPSRGKRSLTPQESIESIPDMAAIHSHSLRAGKRPTPGNSRSADEAFAQNFPAMALVGITIPMVLQPFLGVDFVPYDEKAVEEAVSPKGKKTKTKIEGGDEEEGDNDADFDRTIQELQNQNSKDAGDEKETDSSKPLPAMKTPQRSKKTNPIQQPSPADDSISSIPSLSMSPLSPIPIVSSLLSPNKNASKNATPPVPKPPAAAAASKTPQSSAQVQQLQSPSEAQSNPKRQSLPPLPPSSSKAKTAAKVPTAESNTKVALPAVGTSVSHPSSPTAAKVPPEAETPKDIKAYYNSKLGVSISSGDGSGEKREKGYYNSGLGIAIRGSGGAIKGPGDEGQDSEKRENDQDQAAADQEKQKQQESPAAYQSRHQRKQTSTFADININECNHKPVAGDNSNLLKNAMEKNLFDLSPPNIDSKAPKKLLSPSKAKDLKDHDKTADTAAVDTDEEDGAWHPLNGDSDKGVLAEEQEKDTKGPEKEENNDLEEKKREEDGSSVSQRGDSNDELLGEMVLSSTLSLPKQLPAQHSEDAPETVVESLSRRLFQGENNDDIDSSTNDNSDSRRISLGGEKPEVLEHQVGKISHLEEQLATSQLEIMKLKRQLQAQHSSDNSSIDEGKKSRQQLEYQLTQSQLEVSKLKLRQQKNETKVERLLEVIKHIERQMQYASANAIDEELLPFDYNNPHFGGGGIGHHEMFRRASRSGPNGQSLDGVSEEETKQQLEEGHDAETKTEPSTEGKEGTVRQSETAEDDSESDDLVLELEKHLENVSEQLQGQVQKIKIEREDEDYNLFQVEKLVRRLENIERQVIVHHRDESASSWHNTNNNNELLWVNTTTTMTTTTTTATAGKTGASTGPDESADLEQKLGLFGACSGGGTGGHSTEDRQKLEKMKGLLYRTNEECSYERLKVEQLIAILAETERSMAEQRNLLSKVRQERSMGTLKIWQLNGILEDIAKTIEDCDSQEEKQEEEIDNGSSVVGKRKIDDIWQLMNELRRIIKDNHDLKDQLKERQQQYEKQVVQILVEKHAEIKRVKDEQAITDKLHETENAWLEEVIKRLVQDAKDAEKQRKDQESKLRQNILGNENQIQQQTQVITYLRKHLKEIEKQKNVVVKEKSRVNDALAMEKDRQIKRLKDEIKNIKEKVIEEATSEKEGLQRQIKELQRLTDDNHQMNVKMISDKDAEMKRLKEKLDVSQKLNDVITAGKEGLQEAVDRLGDQIKEKERVHKDLLAEKEEEINRLNEKLNVSEKLNDDVSGGQERLQEAIKHLREQIEDNERAYNKSLSGKKDEITQLNVQLAANNQTAQQIRKEKERSEATIQQLSNQIEEKEGLYRDLLFKKEEEIEKLTEQVSTYEKMKEEVGSQREGLQHVIKQVREQLESTRQEVTIKLQAQREENEKQLRRQKDDLSKQHQEELDCNQITIDDLTKQLEEKNELLKSQEQQLDREKEAHSTEEQRIKDLNSELREYTKKTSLLRNQSQKLKKEVRLREEYLQNLENASQKIDPAYVEELKQTIKGLEETVEKERSEKDTKMKHMSETHAQELEKLKAESSERLQKIEEQLKSNNSTVYMEEVEDYADKKVKAEYEKQVEQHKTEMNELQYKLNQLELQHAEEVEQFKARLTRAKVEKIKNLRKMKQQEGMISAFGSMIGDYEAKIRETEELKAEIQQKLLVSQEETRMAQEQIQTQQSMSTPPSPPSPEE